MSKDPVLFILLDAFRWDYLSPDTTPYLWDLAHRSVYVRQLKPNFGFCERSEVFTGTRPVVNGYLTAFAYGPDHSPFAPYKWELKLWQPLDWLLNGRYVRYALRRYLSARGCTAPVYQIPLSLLPLFALTEDAREHWKQGGFSIESVFDILLAEQKSFYYDAFTSLGLKNGDDANRISLLLAHVGEQHHLFLLYVGSPDAVCHRYGTDSDESRVMLRQVDAQVAEIHAEFRECYSDLNLVLVGDHGMTDVVHYLDVNAELRDAFSRMANVRMGRDCLMFLDSTMARFWFRNSEAEPAIRSLLSMPQFVQCGQILTKELARELHIPPPPNPYGDLIWLANPGVVVFPDYFHTYRPVKAMHGYHPDHPTAKGMAIINTSDVERKKIEEAHLIDVCPTLCDLLEIRCPASNTGVSLLQNS